MIKCFLFFITIFVFNSSVSQVNIFEEMTITNDKAQFVEINDTYAEAIKYLPKNYKTDGTEDYTHFIQKAIDENQNLLLPNFPILINDLGLQLKSNSNIYFQSQSILLMKPSRKSKFTMINLSNVRNVNLYNVKLIGDRNTHLNEKGEWGMGISIYGSTNINIYNIDIKDTWGDGIYINSQKDKQSRNVLIRNGHIDNARRNGISIISGENITIDNVLVSNTNGTRPAAGIDIEPNHRTDVLKNITLKNIKTINSENEGILIVLTRIGSPDFNKEVSIFIENHIDVGSNYAMRFGSGFRKNDKPLAGEIKIENSRWDNFRNDGIIKITGNLNNLPKVSFKNPKVEKGQSIDFTKHLKRIQKSNKQFQIVN